MINKIKTHTKGNAFSDGMRVCVCEKKQSNWEETNNSQQVVE